MSLSKRSQQFLVNYFKENPKASIHDATRTALSKGYLVNKRDVVVVRQKLQPILSSRAVQPIIQVRCGHCGSTGHSSSKCPDERFHKVFKPASAPPFNPPTLVVNEKPPPPPVPPMATVPTPAPLKEEAAPVTVTTKEPKYASANLRPLMDEEVKERLRYMEDILLENPSISPDEVDARLRVKFNGKSVGVDRISFGCRTAREAAGLPPLPKGSLLMLRNQRTRHSTIKKAAQKATQKAERSKAYSKKALIISSETTLEESIQALEDQLRALIKKEGIERLTITFNQAEGKDLEIDCEAVVRKSFKNKKK